MRMLSRRAFAQLGGTAAFAGCAAPQVSTSPDGRLKARPGAATVPVETRGTFELGEWPRPLAYVPERLDASQPAPLVLLLHGAGQQAGDVLKRMQPAAKDRGVVILAPQAARHTWDIIRDASGSGGEPRFSDDAQRIDAALAALFRKITIDPARVAIAGFSDGASYALSLGPRNPGLFTHVMAFSPGGVAPFSDAACARVFISHGRKDPILPFAGAAQSIVPGFRSGGFDVRFEPFDGVHAFRDEEIAKALDWFLA